MITDHNMKEFASNPRLATKEFLSDLEKSMKELGDISAIIYNRRSGSIVGGNQRSKVININSAQIEITKRLDKKNRQGTLALGYVIYNGIRFNYREVDWTAKKEAKANIIANSMSADWDMDVLKETWGERSEDLLKFGFEAKQIPWIDIDKSIKKTKTTPTSSGPGESSNNSGNSKPTKKEKKLTGKVDGITNFSISMKYKNKMLLNDTINSVKESQGFDTIEESLMYIIEQFRKPS